MRDKKDLTVLQVSVDHGHCDSAAFHTPTPRVEVGAKLKLALIFGGPENCRVRAVGGCNRGAGCNTEARGIAMPPRVQGRAGRRPRPHLVLDRLRDRSLYVIQPRIRIAPIIASACMWAVCDRRTYLHFLRKRSFRSSSPSMSHSSQGMFRQNSSGGRTCLGGGHTGG